MKSTSIQKYFQTVTTPKAETKVVGSIVPQVILAPAAVMPCVGLKKRKQSKEKILLGDHVEQALPSAIEEKPEASWNFLKRASNLPTTKDITIIPGVTRLKDGNLVLITKDGKQIKVTEH